MNRIAVRACCCAAVILLANTVPAMRASATAASYLADAVSDSNRPAEDKAQDDNRKPLEVLKFVGVRRGDTIADLMPGSGYYTRIFSKIAGARGKVYAVQPIEMDKEAPKGLISLKSFAGTPAYRNVTVLVQPAATLALPEKADLVWTSLNYHDLHDPFLGSPDMRVFDKSVYDALKPGGIFLVLDHVAEAGTGFSKTNDLHRVDPAAVKAEVTSAGFEFVGESEVLRNAADDHHLGAFNAAIRGRTDKFIYKFRKPLR